MMPDSLACAACVEAEQNPLTGAYRAQCRNCGARALANSPEYHASTVAGAMTPAYAASLRLIFGSERADRDAGHQTVKAWDQAVRQARQQRLNQAMERR
jgi:hypothetical protein